MGLQCIERGRNPILAALAHLVVRAVEDQGKMHYRGTRHISVRAGPAANPEDE
jgi:hypothetical protein